MINTLFVILYSASRQVSILFLVDNLMSLYTHRKNEEGINSVLCVNYNYPSVYYNIYSIDL